MNELIEIIDKYNLIHYCYFMINICKNAENYEEIKKYESLIDDIYKSYGVSNCGELIKQLEDMYLNINLENNHELCKRVIYALQHESNFDLNSSDEIFLKIYSDIINQGLYNPNWAIGSSSEPMFTMLPERVELLEINLLIFKNDNVNWQILRNGTDSTLSFIFKYINAKDNKLKKYYLEIIKKSLTSSWNIESGIRYHDEQQNFHLEVDKVSEKVKKLYNINLTDFLNY